MFLNWDRMDKLERANKLLLEIVERSKNPQKNIPSSEPRWRFSPGNITTLKIPDSLPYAGALNKIKSELINSGVTIIISAFYTEIPIKLHNHLNEITYNFIKVNGVDAIAYEIAFRHVEGTIYNEIDYAGNVLFSCGTYGGFPSSSPHFKQHAENMRRIYTTIGEYKHYADIKT